MYDVHQFHFFELMLTNDATCIPAIAARFRAKTGRVRGEPDGKRFQRHDLVLHDIRKRHFAGGNQV
jgi:hypothetical protein